MPRPDDHQRHVHDDEDRARRLGQIAIGATYVALIAVIPVLIYVGYHRIYNTTAGHTLDPINDPAKPGFVANVTPTPVELAAEVDANGKLIGVVVLSLGSGAAGGSVLFLPAATNVPTAGGGTLADGYAKVQSAGLSAATGAVLRAGFDGVAVIDPTRWAGLVAPVAPIIIENPDRLPSPNGRGTAFASGPIALTADQVGPYLSATRPGESDLTRLARHQLFWDAWLQAVEKANRPDAIPGETATGLGRFLTALAAGPRDFAQLPVVQAPSAAGAPTTFDALPAPVAATVARVIPFPTSDQAGERVRVRVLDGVGTPGLAADVARRLVPAGAEIAVVGNADRFGYATSEIRYSNDDKEDEANVMQQALGVGALVRKNILDDVVDVTIVVGADYPTTTSGSSSGG